VRLTRFRKAKVLIRYSVVPSEDAHQSEYVAASDKRREFISGSVVSFLSFSGI